MEQHGFDVTTFEEHRPLLLAIAYRMLGSASEAEDIVQDAWVRARQDGAADIRSPRAYLTTIVTRLCIDQLRSAERTRMEYPGPWLPEPIAEPNQEPVELASSLRMAFLVLLEKLTPTERAVFLLRDVFEMDFAAIAQIVGKTEANTRQILVRGRARLRNPEPRATASRRESEEVVRRFREAVLTGDLNGLMAVLDPDAQLIADGGGKVPSATRPVLGANRVVRFLLGYAAKLVDPPEFSPVSVNGTPGLLFRHELAGTGAYAFDIVDGRIRTIYVVRNPDKLRTFLAKSAALD